MSEEELIEVLRQFDEKRVEELPEKTRNIFYAIMKIADERDELRAENRRLKRKGDKMKKMVYQEDRKIELLYQGEYKGYKFYILNLGTHPTAYIEIPKDNNLFKKNYDSIDLYVHGGLTYSDSVLFISENEKAEGEWFIGWDYAHWNDYMPYYDEMNFNSRHNNFKKWTTEEIKQECENAIDELKDKEG